MRMEKTFLLSEGELNIFCRQSQPDRGEIRQVVLGVHGLCGSSEDEIQVGVAEEMEIFGAATLRFDFPGHGESPMSDAYLTLPNCKRTLMAAAAYARQQYPQVEELCIFASGFGAYVTLLCLDDLAQMPGTIRLVVQTPDIMMHETLLNMKRISHPTFQAMESITFRQNRFLTIPYSFYEELQENVAMFPCPVPMLILFGENDDYASLEHVREFRQINEDTKLVIIPGTSYDLKERNASNTVMDLARDWFEFQQVLVTDWE